ncbi:MAG: hypothetical protein WDM71_10635 [Ferruginibacter sp.]
MDTKTSGASCCRQSHECIHAFLKLGLTENNPVIKPYDEVAWANLSDTKNIPVNVSLTLLHSLHIRLVELLKNVKRRRMATNCFSS